MEKKKVCQITTVHSPFDNRIYHKECMTLAEAGFEVVLVAPWDESKSNELVKIIPVKIAKNRFIRIFKSSLIDTLFTVLKVKADIYHFHDPELIPLGLVLRLLGKKVIYDVHENVGAALRSRAYLKYDWIRKLVAGVTDVIEYLAGRFFSGVVVARPDIGEKFKHKNLCLLHNFPQLVNTKNIKQVEIEKNKKAVIYVGGMTRIRGIKELVDAFALVEDAELWLLGPFTEGGLQEECEKSPGWKNTRYFGKVSVNEVFSYIVKADIGIVTFLSAPNHLRTLATKPFEYMACGLPMVMSDFPYWKKFFKESSLYADPASPHEIANAINTLISNPELMDKMGELNRELAHNKYNWEKEKEVFCSWYEQWNK